MAASSGREMGTQLVQSRLQTLRISAAIPPSWECCSTGSKEVGLLKNLARTGSAVTGLAVMSQPREPSPQINLCTKISKWERQGISRARWEATAHNSLYRISKLWIRPSHNPRKAPKAVGAPSPWASPHKPAALHNSLQEEAGWQDHAGTTSPGRSRQGELLPAQPSPGQHSPAHTGGSMGPGQTPIAEKMQKRLISFPFSPLHGLPWCLPSSLVHPAYCWQAAGAVPGTGSPGAAGAQTPTAEAAARAVVMQPVGSS